MLYFYLFLTIEKSIFFDKNKNYHRFGNSKKITFNDPRKLFYSQN